jgi:2,5-diamino-6-(ribosylamino)-4(3H)-pyrimidinone 5'-phosphate reductase
MEITRTRPYTTLFLLQSLDGKITTGNNDSLDTDKDFRRIVGVKEGLQQYYELEKGLDRVYFNSGRVMQKVGMNEKVWIKNHNEDLSFVVVDSKPHLTKKGCEYFARRSEGFYLITSNSNHPVFELIDKYKNIKALLYKNKIDFMDCFKKLKKDYGITRMTVQTGGDLNAVLIREKLIDEVLVVVAPCLVGGRNTQSLIGGESLHTQKDLKKIGVLKLIKAKVLKNSYMVLNYKVLDNTKVEK